MDILPSASPADKHIIDTPVAHVSDRLSNIGRGPVREADVLGLVTRVSAVLGTIQAEETFLAGQGIVLADQQRTFSMVEGVPTVRAIEDVQPHPTLEILFDRDSHIEPEEGLYACGVHLDILSTYVLTAAREGEDFLGGVYSPNAMQVHTSPDDGPIVRVVGRRPRLLDGEVPYDVVSAAVEIHAARVMVDAVSPIERSVVKADHTAWLGEVLQVVGATPPFNQRHSADQTLTILRGDMLHSHPTTPLPDNPEIAGLWLRDVVTE